eukprot:TRINITY_DN50775_c0_g1_i1.p1 TRINITY_DN50775_c0_g1~~TRINITY_DN50775_c0_g1_i1.p1  ORF type:complete len:535 (+),score=250.67 TRINITY_DN50775_c0_g1_i1:69-1673(+)
MTAEVEVKRDDMVYLSALKKELTLRLEEAKTTGMQEALGDLILLRASLYKTAKSVVAGDSPADASNGQNGHSNGEEAKEDDKTEGAEKEKTEEKEKGEEEKEKKADVVEEVTEEINAAIIEKLREANEEAYQICKDCLGMFSSLEKESPEVPRSGDRPVGVGDDGHSLPYSSKTVNMFNVPLKRRLQTVTVMIMNFFLGIPLFIGTWILLHLIPFLFPFMIMYDLYMIYHLIFPPVIPHPEPKSFRNWTAWKYMRDYFPIALRIEDSTLFRGVGKIYGEDGKPVEREAEPSGQKNNYLFTIHPHGLHSFGAFLNFATNATGIDELMPELKISTQTLAIQFKLPLWRELLMGSGMGDANRGTLLKVLNGPPGSSAALVVGGAEEALNASPGTFDLILHKRKGFVRIALQTGAHLVPCFSFGENDVYRPLTKETPQVRSFLRRVQSVLGFAVPLFMGRGVFSYGFGLLPHRRRVTMVIGKPILVEKWQKPWDPKDKELAALVDELHKKYEEELTDLYNRHKDVYALNRTSDLRITQ